MTEVMNCDWTEKISLLIDGELDADAARAAEGHLAACAACRDAREDFLLLRRQISSYPLATDAVAQRAALRRILGADASGVFAPDAASSAARGWRERAGGLFALPRLGPALAGSFALLLVAVLVGVFALRKVNRVEVARDQQRGQNVNGNANAVVAPAPTASTNEQASSASASSSEKSSSSNDTASSRTPPTETLEKSPATVASKDGVSVESASTSSRGRAQRRLAAEGARATEARQPKIVDRLKLPVAPKLAVDSAELVETEIASLRSKVEPDDLSTSQHVEQAQRLLRSFRNARVEGSPSDADVAYEKRRARDLLYRNIVLRREAQARGRGEVASVLDSLEPILIDIANLPDRPAEGDVRAITERMRKKNIVAMLQVANGSRMY